MAYTTIKKPSDYFNTKLYTGNNNITQTISGVGFQPDWVWIKNRDNVEGHYLFDAVRGSGKILSSANTNAEADLAINTKPTIASDGFTLTSNGVADELNFGTRTYASWNWLANGTGSANTDGSISSTVSANTTSGFSIVKYTSTGTANSTIGHGLNATPTNVIIKCTSDGATSWISKMKGADGYLYLNNTDALTSNSTWLPTDANTFTLANTWGAYNTSGRTYIAYCFAEKQGYSKFGSYLGNGSTDGTFVYTGFKPAWLVVKRSSASGDNWIMWDNKRNPFNVTENKLEANDSGAEAINAGSNKVDFLSNGFKMRTASAGNNASGSTYIYMAFAEEPLVGDNPATAR